MTKHPILKYVILPLVNIPLTMVSIGAIFRILTVIYDIEDLETGNKANLTLSQKIIGISTSLLMFLPQMSVFVAYNKL